MTKSTRLTWRATLGLSAGAGLALLPAMAAAHGGAPPAPHDLREPTFWLPDPLVVVSIGLGVLAYRQALRRTPRRLRMRGHRTWRAAAFWLGLAAFVLALSPPIEPLAVSLLSVHMGQHLLLVVIATPLLVLAAPSYLVWSLLPRTWRAPVGRAIGRRQVRHVFHVVASLPVAALLLAGSLAAWHAPWMYEQALVDERLHLLEHAAFVGSSALFWWAALRPGQPSGAYGWSVVALFLIAAEGSALGALMTFSREPWYGMYSATATAWGIEAMADQRAAGLLMWMPGGLAYAIAAAAFVVAWLAAADRRTSGREALASSERTP